jgi:CheY-like chemotaxis protein
LYKPHSEDDTKYLNYPTIEDDRKSITENDKVVLIIEDDLKFASILLKQANNKGFKCLSASTGEDGLLLATKYKPQAIILDMALPGINGHNVLFELKANPSVRHIPVHIISANERSLEPIKEGAVEYLMKPIDKKDLEETFTRIENFISRKIKNLLIIEDSENSRKAMRILIGNGDVKCFEAGTGKEALIMYEQNHIDCIILDIGLPDMSGFDLIHKLENIKSHNIPPIIVYTGKELTKEENNELQKYAESIIIKGVKSEERLLDETALFLHRTIGNLPKSKQLIINNLHDKEAVFHSKKILLVDDDMRNVFALSKILTERGMEIIKAENGKNALEMLDTCADIDMVLMDIMMPVMDGYEAMKQIRAKGKFRKLPIIALTAKAMKDDKQKCIDAGANDYITKPIDVERLLSLMRVWLSK